MGNHLDHSELKSQKKRDLCFYEPCRPSAVQRSRPGVGYRIARLSFQKFTSFSFPFFPTISSIVANGILFPFCLFGTGEANCQMAILSLLIPREDWVLDLGPLKVAVYGRKTMENCAIDWHT